MAGGVLEQLAERLAAIEAAIAALAEQVRAPAPGAGDGVWADGVISVTDAPAFCGVSRTELYQMMNRGELPWSKPARDRLIPRRALVALLEQHAHNTEAEASLT